MNLREYREKKGLGYEELGRRLRISTNKAFRLCKSTEDVKLKDAKRIVSGTEGEVQYSDLLKGV